MPSPVDILQELTNIANQNMWLAIAWHIAVALGLGALLLGWRPGIGLAVLASVIPLASVATLAWAYGNPFNGLVISLLGGLLLAYALRILGRDLTAGPMWSRVAAGLMIAFAWIYPHFLVGQSELAYLYGAPLGLVPCPTLSLVIGVALLANGFNSRLWSFTLAAAGLFYGAFGALRLGVTIDLVLVLGAVALAVLSLTTIPLVRRITTGFPN